MQYWVRDGVRLHTSVGTNLPLYKWVASALHKKACLTIWVHIILGKATETAEQRESSSTQKEAEGSPLLKCVFFLSAILGIRLTPR